MRRDLTLAIGIALTFLNGVSLAAESVAANGNDWIALYNGRDLDDWTQRSGTAMYRVEDKTNVGTTSVVSPKALLCTQTDLDDFELIFEAKSKSTLIPGILIRSPSSPVFVNNCPLGSKVDLKAAPGEAGYTYSECLGCKWMAQKYSKNPPININTWNDFRVIAFGPHIQTWVNGELAFNLIDETSPKSGFIGLQVHGIPSGSRPFEIHWRNIRLKELKSDAETPPGITIWCVNALPSDGKLLRPDSVGNITAAYFAHDSQRTPLAVEFNTDATEVHIQASPRSPQPRRVAIVLETAEESREHSDGRIVFSALDAKVIGSRARLETHPGNYRIGFWNNADDYVSWDKVGVSEGEYDVELTYSTASPDGTEMALEMNGKTLPVALMTTGSWYKYTTVRVGLLDIAKADKYELTVKCKRKVGEFVINLKAVTLRPCSNAP